MNHVREAATVGYAFVWRWLAMVCLTEALLIMVIAGTLTPSEQMLLRPVFLLLLALMLMPYAMFTRPYRAIPHVLWIASSATALLPGLLWRDAVPFDTALLLAAGTAVLVLFFSCLGVMLASCLHDRRLAARICLCAIVLCLAIPLWASPLASLYGGSKWLVDAIIAICPVSYLAALADIDFLRGQWFYQHTPYGSLRFDYPDTWRATLLLLVTGPMLAMLGTMQFRRHTTPLTQPLKPLEIKS